MFIRCFVFSFLSACNNIVKDKIINISPRYSVYSAYPTISNTIGRIYTQKAESNTYFVLVSSFTLSPTENSRSLSKVISIFFPGQALHMAQLSPQAESLCILTVIFVPSIFSTIPILFNQSRPFKFVCQFQHFRCRLNCNVGNLCATDYSCKLVLS